MTPVEKKITNPTPVLAGMNNATGSTVGVFLIALLCVWLNKNVTSIVAVRFCFFFVADNMVKTSHWSQKMRELIQGQLERNEFRIWA